MRISSPKITAFLTTLLLGQFLVSIPSSAEGPKPNTAYDQNASQSTTSGIRPCGPDCKCGCNEGKPCTCHKNGPKPTPQAQPPQPLQYQYQPEPQIQYQPQFQAAIPEANAAYYSTAQVDADNYSTASLAIQSAADNSEDDSDDDSCYTRHNDMMVDFITDCHCNDTIRPTHVDPSLSTCEPCGGTCGTWLPEDPVLFRPFMADPREIDYSVGWRWNDNALTKNIIDVSFGDTFALYRWCDVWPWHGDLQIELEGAVWATFDPMTFSAPLMNADYYVGFPLSYAIERWQFRLRFYHISSHIGDEFLINHPDFDRRNASAEYLDFFISHDFTEEIRFYGGVGYVLQQDEEFKTKRFYSALGAELRLLSIGFLDTHDMLYGCPIFGMHFRQNGEFRNHIDATYILGYEFGKLCGLYRKLRFFMEYHDGYSVEGQYFKVPTNYFSIRMSYGF